jgi:hypothetical protein
MTPSRRVVAASHLFRLLHSFCFIYLILAPLILFTKGLIFITMSEALLGDDSSQASSQRSALSGSLLERIRAQRGETAPRSAPEPPVYTNPEEPAISSNNERWSLNVSWPHVLTPGSHSHEDTASEALLSPSTPDDGYSMCGYLKTFVQDFYNLFRSMHPAVQVVVVIVLLYIAIKLI